MDAYRRNALLEMASLLASRDQQLDLWTAGLESKPGETMLSPRETVEIFFDYWRMIEGFGEDVTCLSRVQLSAAYDLMDGMAVMTADDFNQHPDRLIDRQTWRDVRALAARFLLAWQND